jgi:protocatechuate 3,4-dioxygenase beta subunit
MWTRLVFVACTVAVQVAVAALPAAQTEGQGGTRPQRFASSVAATTVVRGRVTSVTGGAVRGAEIRAREVNGRETRLVTTDDAGVYELRDLVPGSWNLTASKTGFITQQYGQKRPFAATEPLTVGERQSVQANFTLGRAGAISGRVLDEFGDPVAGARVQVLRSRFTRGRRTLAPTGVGDQTDDTGAFRLYALPPGDYFVGAAQRAATAETPMSEAQIGPQTYYPGTTVIAEAQRIRLGAGEEQPNITFPLSPVRAVRVSGTVLSARGGPAEDASVRLVNAGDFSLVGVPLGNFGMSQANGAFTFINVVPGSYILEAHAGSVFGGLTEGAENASMPVTIGPEDVTGLTITTAPGGAITGLVTTENGAPPPAGVQIRFEATTGGMQFESTIEGRSRPGGPGRGGALPPYSFRLPVTAGGFHLGVTAPQGWMLKAIDIGGSDVTDKPIEVRSGNTEARVVLTDRVTQVDGSVTSGTRPAPAVDVVVFPDEPALWAFPARHVRVLKSAADGTFSVRGIPPHQAYLAVALDYLDEGETQDPEFLAGLRNQATRFSIDYGEARTVALRAVERR